MNDLIIHLHIPKTGGTTLRDIIQRQYLSKNILTIPTLEKSENILETVPSVKINQLEVVQGHLKYGIHFNLNRGAKYFAILRNPIDRVLSTYYYVISQDNNPQNLSSNDNTMSIFEYVNSGINPFLINGQTQLISGKTCSINDPLIKSKELLSIAKKNIKENFIFTGTTEQFDESILLLKGILRWKSPYYSRANKTKNKPDYKKIDKKIRDFIKAHNQLDINLYNYVKKSINDKINEGSINFKNELNHFKKINAIINPIFGFSRAKRFLSKSFKK